MGGVTVVGTVDGEGNCFNSRMVSTKVDSLLNRVAINERLRVVMHHEVKKSATIVNI